MRQAVLTSSLPAVTRLVDRGLSLPLTHHRIAGCPGGPGAPWRCARLQPLAVTLRHMPAVLPVSLAEHAPSACTHAATTKNSSRLASGRALAARTCLRATCHLCRLGTRHTAKLGASQGINHMIRCPPPVCYPGTHASYCVASSAPGTRCRHPVWHALAELKRLPAPNLCAILPAQLLPC